MNDENQKKLGIGTGAFPLVVLSILWAFSINHICMGDNILNAIGFNAWSNGNTGIHYAPYYSLVLLTPAFILGKKYPDHFLAKSSKNISLYLGIFLLVIIFGMVLSKIIFS